MMVSYQRVRLEVGENVMVHIRTESEISKISKSCQIVCGYIADA